MEDKKCIFAVPFCAPDERCEREGMRFSRRRGEGQDGPSSLNEWKDVANNSSCFLRASSDSYIKDEGKEEAGTDKQKRKRLTRMESLILAQDERWRQA